MKTNKLKMIGMLMCIAAAFVITSCNREDDTNNNTPLTNETIVGKKYYTDKLFNGEQFVQAEIRFAENNAAYLSCYYTDLNKKTKVQKSIVRASYNLTYPDIIFEDESGNVIFATFTNSNTLVFTSDNTNDFSEEYAVLVTWAIGGNQFEKWLYLKKGWHFSTTPQTITGPYLGQYFTSYISQYYTSYNNRIQAKLIFGANYVCCGVKLDGYYLGSLGNPITGRFTVNYPNLTIEDGFGNTEGYFVDENTIVLTKYIGSDIQEYNIRLRNINAGPEPAPDPGVDNDDDTDTINLPTSISETFANGIPSNWINIDADGDGHMWASTITTSGNLADADGNGAVYSQSYDNDYGALTPDNYLVTPKIHINGGTLSWQVAAQDSGYPNEHYAVLIGRVVNGNFVTIATLFEETFSGNSKAPTDFYNRSVSLSDYSGHNLRIAFRHYDCADNFCLNIDNVVIQ